LPRAASEWLRCHGSSQAPALDVALSDLKRGDDAAVDEAADVRETSDGGGKRRSLEAGDWLRSLHRTITAPPATSTTIPVIQSAASDARNSAARATSSGVPRRLSGWASTS